MLTFDLLFLMTLQANPDETVRAGHCGHATLIFAGAWCGKRAKSAAAVHSRRGDAERAANQPIGMAERRGSPGD